MTRKRERIIWWPEWSEEYQKWSASFISKNQWRCEQINDFDDLMQEAYLVFVYVANSYPRVVNDRHFFALFKRAMINKMHDRACRKKRRKDTIEGPIFATYDVFTQRMGETDHGGFVAAVLNEMPEELKLVLDLLAAGELDPDPPKPHPGVLQPREHISTRAVAALRAYGYHAFGDPVGELKKLLA